MSANNGGPAATGDSTMISIDYLRRFPLLGTKTDEQLQAIVCKLNGELVETVSDLALISRDALSHRIPGLALDVLKPIQQSSSEIKRDDFRELKKLILEKEMAQSKAVSCAEYYQEKLEEGRVEQWSPAPRESFDADQVQLPSCLEQAHNHAGSEKQVVQPFWKGVLRQHKVIPSLQNGFEVTHLGTKIPDIAFFKDGIAKPTAQDFVAAGDCKGSTWTGTSSAELGQMLLYVHRMLDAQPVREIGYGFVTNNQIIVLVKGYRSSASPFPVRWCISNVLNFDHGMKLWLQLMREDNGYSESPLVDGFPISFKQILRPGGTCRAFGATYRGELVVAKLYSSVVAAADNASRAKRASEAALSAKTGASSLARLPLVVATEGCWSLIAPKGHPMTRDMLTTIHVERLVSTLQIIHAAGIIHRDVRMSNIFYLTDHEILLNDWGSSVVKNERTMYAGSPEPHIHPGIALSDLYDPSPKHDLYSLVSSVAQLLLPGAKSESRREFFAEAFQSVEACDYGGVMRGIVKHMRM